MRHDWLNVAINRVLAWITLALPGRPPPTESRHSAGHVPLSRRTGRPSARHQSGGA